MKAVVTFCVLVVSVAGTRERRGFDQSSISRIGVSSGYGAAYTAYGDYSSYVLAPIRDYSPPAYVYTPTVTQKIVPQVISVRKVVRVPTNKVVVPSFTPGYIGYGSGLRSGYFGYSDRAGYSRYAGYPGFSGYASHWW